MVAYNFQARFVDDILSGRKRQTIRAIGKRRHALRGESLQIYTGMRTASCRKILCDDPICTAVAPVEIYATSAGQQLISIAGVTLDPLEAYAFACADGFNSARAMVDYFQQVHGLPFTGVCIQW